MLHLETIKPGAFSVLKHSRTLLRPELNIDDIRMFSIEDIITMKVQALLGRVKRKIFGI